MENKKIEVGDVVFQEKNGEIIRRYQIARVSKLYAFSKTRINNYEIKFTRDPQRIRVVPRDRFSFENYVIGTPEIQQRYDDFRMRIECFEFLRNYNFRQRTTEQLRRIVSILRECDECF